MTSYFIADCSEIVQMFKWRPKKAIECLYVIINCCKVFNVIKLDHKTLIIRV